MNCSTASHKAHPAHPCCQLVQSHKDYRQGRTNVESLKYVPLDTRFSHVRVICGFEEARMLTEEILEFCWQAQCLSSSNARVLSFTSADTSFTYTTSRGPAAKGSSQVRSAIRYRDLNLSFCNLLCQTWIRQHPFPFYETPLRFVRAELLSKNA